MASWLEAKRQRKKWVAFLKQKKGEAAANVLFNEDLEQRFSFGEPGGKFMVRGLRKDEFGAKLFSKGV